MPGSLDDISQKLSDPTVTIAPSGRTKLAPLQNNTQARGEWQKINVPVTQTPSPQAQSRKLLDKLFIASIVFFVLTLLIAMSAWFFNFGSVSNDDIDIKILTPASLTAGESQKLDIQITNKNKDELKNTKVIVDFPLSTQDEEGGELIKVIHDLGGIAGESLASSSFQYIPFGDKGQDIPILVTLEYFVEGSDVAFKKEVRVAPQITSSPLSALIEFPEIISRGEQFSFTIALSSSEEKTVENMALKAQYPQGFTLISARRAPDSGTNIWEIPRLEAREKEIITITGLFDSSQDIDPIFRFSVMRDESLSSTTPRTIMSISKKIIVKQAPISLSMSLPDSRFKDGELTSSAPLPLSLTWENSSGKTITDGIVSLEVDGMSVGNISTNGFIDNSSQSVRWTSSEANLASIVTGNSGGVQAVLPIIEASGSQIVVRATLEGRSGGAARTILATSKLIIKKSSKVELTSVGATRSPSKDFNPRGPYPPLVDYESNFEITFNISSGRDVRNARMTAKLAPGALVETVIDPSRGSARAEGSSLYWDIGDIQEGAGEQGFVYYLPVILTFTPTEKDVGKIPMLLYDVRLVGEGPGGVDELISSIGSISTQAQDLKVKHEVRRK